MAETGPASPPAARAANEEAGGGGVGGAELQQPPTTTTTTDTPMTPSSATDADAPATPTTTSSAEALLPPPSSSLAAVVDRLFRGTACLAPMVRAGTLPFRLLCLGYGADVVWGEEIIDRKMLDCERRVNERLGTVDFVNRKDGRLIFATTAAERGRVIFQLGASPRNPEWAVRAALLVAGDVAAVDVNMGCPKKFSVQDGMGAALLDNEAGAAGLIRALRAALPLCVPVACKIRLLDTAERTLAFAKAMEAAGCAAIGVHMRARHDKSSAPARWQELKPLVDGLTVPVIANGDLYTRQHVEELRASMGDPRLAVMLARPALYNPSVFRTLKGKDAGAVLAPLDEVMREYVRLCLRYENHVSNTKVLLMELMSRKRHPDHLKDSLSLELPEGKTIPIVSRLKSTAALAALFGLDAAPREGPGGQGQGEEGERQGLHVCSDAYFATEGAVVVVEKKEEEVRDGGGGSKRSLVAGEEGQDKEVEKKRPRVSLVES